MTVVRIPNRRIWNRDTKIKFCKDSVKAVGDYEYVEWDNLEEYQIDKWVEHFDCILGG